MATIMSTRSMIGDYRAVATGVLLVLATAGSAHADAAGEDATSAAADCDNAQDSCAILLGVTIDGAKAFSSAELAGAYEDFLTRQVGVDDLAMVAARITKRYLDEGYFLSQAIVPPQDLSGGIARIVVIEGRISSVDVQGAGAKQVEPFVSSLPSQTIANLKDIDRRLTLASDVPGISVRSSIEALPEDPALHRMVVTTEFDATEAQIYLDNRGGEAIGPLQAYGRFSANSLFAAGDQATLSAYTTPEDPSGLSQVGGSYRYLFGGKSELGVSMLRSQAEDGFDPATPQIGGDGATTSIWYSRSLERSRSRSVWFDATLEAGHFQSEWTNGGGYSDELRVARVMLRGRFDQAGQSSNILMRISAGLDALGASGSSIDRRSRSDADGSFTKLDFQASHYRDIGRHFGIYGALGGQWSADPLLLSEEFAAGGTNFGRAYNYGEISGDQAIGAVVELRAGFNPDLEAISFLQGYLFYEAAEAWNYHTPEDAGELSISSAGVGLRMDFGDWLTARVETARPLTRTPYETGDKDWRQFFSLSASY